MIVSAGEALVDLMPVAATDAEPQFAAIVGGSPLNVAIALGRLDAPSAFLGAVSTDAFGARIMAALEESGVETSLVTRVARPTPLAVVTLDGPEPRYEFYDTGTALRGMTLRELAPLPSACRIFHFGSIALAGEPAASTLLARARVARATCLVTVDPNVRPAFAPGESAYRRNLDQAMALAHVVKLSLDDLAWLRPGQAAEDFARDCLSAGARLVAVTRGAGGAVAFSAAGTSEAATPVVDIADTIGAGDAFMAGLLAGIGEASAATPELLGALERGTVATILRFATRVAADTCRRRGADPPWRAELERITA